MSVFHRFYVSMPKLKNIAIFQNPTTPDRNYKQLVIKNVIIRYLYSINVKLFTDEGKLLQNYLADNKCIRSPTIWLFKPTLSIWLGMTLFSDKFDSLIDWLIIYSFTSRSRIFHLYRDVTISGEGLQNLGLCSALRAWAGRDLYRAKPAVTNLKNRNGFFFFISIQFIFKMYFHNAKFY
jgi:hypothetical protein